MSEFYKNLTPSVKGFIFEELVISILLNNKSNFKNLKITETKIMDDMKDIKTVNNLQDGPIFIIQQTNQQVFDLVLFLILKIKIILLVNKLD